MGGHVARHRRSLPMIPTPRRSWLTPFTHFVVTAIALFAPRLLPAQVPAPADGPAAAPAVAVPTQVERPLLWRIELATPSYLFGTIHLPDERVTKLPPVVADVLDRCDALYTELPLELTYLMKQMDGMQLPKGATLRGALGDELYDEVAAYAEPPARDRGAARPPREARGRRGPVTEGGGTQPKPPSALAPCAAPARAAGPSSGMMRRCSHTTTNPATSSNATPTARSPRRRWRARSRR